MPELLAVVFIIALIAVAVAQIILIYQQVELTRRLTDHLRDGLAQTARAADAANSTAGMVKLALEVSARANIAIESITLIDPRTEGNRRIADRAARSCIEIVVKNNGATPAKDLRFEFVAEMPPYIEEPASITGHRAELHSQCTTRPVFKPLKDMCSEFYKDADLNLCLEDLRVKGQVRYKDIFNNSYYVECSARFDPVAWEFEVVTDSQSGAHHHVSSAGNAAVAARVGDNRH